MDHDLITFDGRADYLAEHTAWLDEYRAETARIRRAAFNAAKREKVFAVVNSYAKAIGLTPRLIDSYLFQRVHLKLLFCAATQEAIAAGKVYASELLYLVPKVAA